MMKRTFLPAFALLFGMAGSIAACTQQPAAETDESAAPAAEVDFRASLQPQIDSAEEKLIGLAEAIPPEAYTWRPAEGVRSIGEVVAHVAATNYMMPEFMGIAPPEGVDFSTFEQQRTAKDSALQALRESFAHFRQAAQNVSDDDMGASVSMFGMETTQQGALLTATHHMHEHLGQLIAYARANDVVPPWSE
jgi:uncharacterized damage-inducible protein DinB